MGPGMLVVAIKGQGWRGVPTCEYVTVVTKDNVACLCEKHFKRFRELGVSGNLVEFVRLNPELFA
jgi:hypothetical protein